VLAPGTATGADVEAAALCVCAPEALTVAGA